jgi:hypothetical protein
MESLKDRTKLIASRFTEKSLAVSGKKYPVNGIFGSVDDLLPLAGDGLYQDI